MSEDSEASAYTLENEINEYVSREVQDESSRQPSVLEMYPGISDRVYDFTAERQNPHGTNLIESTAHMIKGCLGAGVLGMHEAFMYGGLWTSLVGTLVIGFLVSYTMLMLANSAQTMYVRIRVPRLSYPDLAEAAVATGPVKQLRRYRKVFRYTVDIFLFMEMCGSCCLFEIMIAQTLKQVLEASSSQIKEADLSIRMYIVITSAPLLLICMITSLKYLAPFSLVADILITLALFVTVFYSISSASDISERPAWKSVQGLFRFLGTCIYSIQGIPVTLPLENSMKSPKHFDTVLQYGMSTVVIAVSTVGFFGYWGLGESCQTPITLQIPMKTTTMIVQFLLAGMMTVTFAIHFWVPFAIIWHYIGKYHKRHRDAWQRFYRTIHVVCISCVAIAFPKVNYMMTFLGAIFCACVDLVFPALIESMVMWKEDHVRWFRWRRLVKNLFLVVFGLIVCAGAIYSHIDNQYVR